MYTLERLQEIVSHIPIDITGCMKCQEMIGSALIKNWSNEFFESGRWKEYRHEDWACQLQGIKIFVIANGIIREAIFSEGLVGNVSRVENNEITCEDLISIIHKKIKKYGTVNIDIETGYGDRYTQHSFVLVGIEESSIPTEGSETVYVVDSYAKCRSCEYRVFDFDAFLNLMKYPSSERWNTLFQGNEKEVREYTWFSVTMTFRN
jgi:hypothetical protein